MILIEIQYKIYNDQFLAIIEVFKIWCYYLESYKHKVFVLTDHNNLCCFINTKSLSFQQVR